MLLKLVSVRFILVFIAATAAACGDNMGSGVDGGGGGGGGEDSGGSPIDGGDDGDSDADPVGPTDGDLCAGPEECAESSVCDPDQSETSGTCSTTPCTVGDDDTCAPGGDGICVDFDSMNGGQDPRCLDPCETDDDCDQGQRCDETGDPQVDGTFCRHAEVGDPCVDADACGGGPWLCVTETEGTPSNDTWPDGYCSLPCAPGGCPAGTGCNDDFLQEGGDPFCVVLCDAVPSDTCERQPDYACQDVNTGAGVTFGCAPSVL